MIAASFSTKAASSTRPRANGVQFEVIDLGLGRVELQASNGKTLSVAEDRVVLKDMGDAKPGDAETFQWVNLMRGDSILMTLTNHRYLATQPNSPGPVTADHTGGSSCESSVKRRPLGAMKHHDLA
jgi:hypothetical protein